MEKQTEGGDMFFRPEGELKRSASLGFKKKLSDLWHSPNGYPFHIEVAGEWRLRPLGMHWQPICLNAPEWILSEFADCYDKDDDGKDASEILKDFAYYLFRNELAFYAEISEHKERGRPNCTCFVGTGRTDYEALADNNMRIL